jgi:hypothetical protein
MTTRAVPPPPATQPTPPPASPPASPPPPVHALSATTVTIPAPPNVSLFTNRTVWGSIDPVNDGAIALYDVNTSNTLEDSFESSTFGSISLDAFGGVTIVFNNGKPYQTTRTGYRSVFRVVLPAGEEPTANDANVIRKVVEFNSYYNAWYLAENKTSHIGFLVDISGSMLPTYNAVVEQGLEEFVEKQKELEQDVLFYGATFSNAFQYLFNGVDLKTTPSIKETYYSITPAGSTAYYDAVMELIESISQRYSIHDEVVICVVTDGGDNSSTQYNCAQMKRMIEQKKELGWNIIMIGMNRLNTEHLSVAYGIGRGATLDAGSTPEQMRSTFTGVSNSISRVRSGATTHVQFSETERNVSH